ncbi:hypothetical protein GJ698_02870 [Pseudoduganella sp. FT26W]|uniref:Uncharacterized protein n=1 Tax=Duganella aquatilis TaxID=2666082 RepID=A0A844D2Y3_9BURK|nr:hypothetical protein [Duganella aquatilis]MRW83032.1 hypothetical protein [Duganella aquatilis]
MEVSAWKNGRASNPRVVYGIRVGVENRAAYFPVERDVIVVEMDNEEHTFHLTDGFRRKCPEFRDSKGTAIRDWLARHRTTDWPRGRPPRFELHVLGDGRFRLVA